MSNKLTNKEDLRNRFYRFRYNIFRILDLLKNRSPEDKGRKLTYVDNFDKVSWMGQKFIVGERWGGWHPDRDYYYYGPPELIEGASCAKFSIKYNPKTFLDKTRKPVTIPFEASRLSSSGIFSQRYGRWEVRMTLPAEENTWSAFWLYGSTWPPEIDIIEYGGVHGKHKGNQEINLHFGHTEDGTKSAMGAWPIRVERKRHAGEKFHEFAVEWKPDRMDFYTNGLKVFTYSRKDVLEWFNVDAAKMKIILSHALKKPTEDIQYESKFYVDYVRVYEMI